MVHFPANPRDFEAQLSGGVPFYRTACDGASTRLTTSLDPARVDCLACRQALEISARVAAASRDGGPEVEVDTSDLDDLAVELEPLEEDGAGVAGTEVQAAAGSCAADSDAGLASYCQPDDSVLIARMLLDPRTDPAGSDGFGEPDSRLSILDSERDPLAELLAMIANFGLSDRALPILRVLHRMSWAISSRMMQDQTAYSRDETGVEPSMDLLTQETGEDRSEGSEE